MSTDLGKFQRHVGQANMYLPEVAEQLKTAGTVVMAADPLAVALMAAEAQLTALQRTLHELGQHLSHRLLYGEEGA
jgi:hypothetical protein